MSEHQIEAQQDEVAIRTGIKAGDNGQMGTGSAVDSQIGSGSATSNGQMGSGN